MITGAFSFSASCTNLSSVDIPKSVTKIGPWAFHSCKSLKAVDVPASVMKIEGEAFHSCDNLEKVTLHEGLYKIGDWAFEFCSNLYSIYIPDSVTDIVIRGSTTVTRGVRRITKHTAALKYSASPVPRRSATRRNMNVSLLHFPLFDESILFRSGRV